MSDEEEEEEEGVKILTRTEVLAGGQRGISLYLECEKSFSKEKEEERTVALEAVVVWGVPRTMRIGGVGVRAVVVVDVVIPEARVRTKRLGTLGEMTEDSQDGPLLFLALVLPLHQHEEEEEEEEVCQ